MTEKPKPRSLVTGSCGFMGTHMVEMLVAAGHEVIATDLESAWADDDRKAGRFPSVVKAAGVQFIASDLTKPETLDPLVKDLDYVFHIASVFSYSAPWSVLRHVNVDGTRALLDKLLVASPNLKRIVVWGAAGLAQEGHRRGRGNACPLRGGFALLVGHHGAHLHGFEFTEPCGRPPGAADQRIQGGGGGLFQVQLGGEQLDIFRLDILFGQLEVEIGRLAAGIVAPLPRPTMRTRAEFTLQAEA